LLLRASTERAALAVSPEISHQRRRRAGQNECPFREEAGDGKRPIIFQSAGDVQNGTAGL